MSNEIDFIGFANEIKTLRSEIESKIGVDDFKHLKKIELWGHLFTILGYGTAWIFPNPLSAFLISQGSMVRWCIMMHHVGHKGYDKVNCPERYKSSGFAKGNRRFIDWLDWMHPMAWKYEHNILHHYHTGESADPDLAERNVEFIRNSNMPIPFKYIIIFLFMCTWKFTYYAPTTYLLNRKAENKRNKMRALKEEEISVSKLFIPDNKTSLNFCGTCLLPYISIRFILIPLVFLPISFHAFLFVLINSLLAELVTNIYTFMIIVPNHAGDDIYRFETGLSDSNEFYVRQVIGSVNYKCGNDRIDLMHGWLNYQIEHHLFPDLPLLKYQQYQQRVKELCVQYNIPYIQESVFKRFRKLVSIMTGKTNMKEIGSDELLKMESVK